MELILKQSPFTISELHAIAQSMECQPGAAEQGVAV